MLLFLKKLHPFKSLGIRNKKKYSEVIKKKLFLLFKINAVVLNVFIV